MQAITARESHSTISCNGVYPLTMEPSLVLMRDLEDNLRFFASVSAVFTMLNNMNFKANHVSLPDFSVDPYAQYGLGALKKLGENVIIKAEVYARSFGRSGLGGQFTFNYMLSAQ